MDIQRLRNLTTGRLHTDIGHIYEDIERLVGEPGIMTHQLPNACRALEPWLRDLLPERFWDGEYDVTHAGEVEMPVMNDAERAEFWKRYKALPSLLAERSNGA